MTREVLENPQRGWVLGLRLLPAPAGRRVLRRLPAGSLHARFLDPWSAGRREEAHEVLLATIAEGDARAVRRAAGLALAVDDASAAAALVDALPEPDPQLSALVEWGSGHLARARADADLSTRATRRIPLSVTRERLAGQDAVLDPAWRAPSLRQLPVQPLVPVPGTVLHVVSNAFPEWSTGYAVRTHEIVTAQATAGLHPHVVTRLGFPVQQGHLAAGPLEVVDGIEYHRLLARGAAAWTEATAMDRNADALLELARRLRPAVLHAATKHENGQLALDVGRVLDLPVAYEVRAFPEQTWDSRHGGGAAGTDRYQRARAVETACMLRAAHVFTLGEGMAEEIESRGVPRERITVVPNCADDRYFAPLPDPAPVRARLGIPEQDVVVGLLTHVVEYEGIDTLIEAVALLRGRGEQVTLLVLGDGLELPRLRARAQQAGLGEHAVLPGRVPYAQVPEHLAALDVYCVPRRDTPVTRLVTPLKPLEAMAAGRPVVASDLPALAEIVADGRTGRLFPAGDAHALAEVLSALAADPDLRSALVGAARTWVRANRTWDANVARYVSAYRRIGAEVPPLGTAEGAAP